MFSREINLPVLALLFLRWRSIINGHRRFVRYNRFFDNLRRFGFLLRHLKQMLAVFTFQGKESFKLLYYEAEGDFANAMMPTWDEDTYRHVDVIAADKVDLSNSISTSLPRT